MSSMSSIYSGLSNAGLFLCFLLFFHFVLFCGLFAFLLLLLFLNAVFVRAGGASMKEYLSFVFGECYCHNYFPV